MPYYIKDNISGSQMMVVNDSHKSDFGLEDRRIERKCKAWAGKLNKSNPDDEWVVEHRAT